MEFDGQLVSELGVKRYMKGFNAAKFSNIKMLQSTSSINIHWQECNFGCHGPSYRVMRRELSYEQFLKQVDNLSPMISGGIDGGKHETIHQVKLAGAGVQRTMEGLGTSGGDKFAQVGAENWAAYNSVKVNVTSLVNLDINLVDNPVMQLVFAIVNEYVSLLPESIVVDMVQDDAIVIPDSIDRTFLLRAAKHGLIEAYKSDELDGAINFLGNKAQRLAGKVMGKKLTRIVAAIIASQIARKILSSPDVNYRLKKRFVKLRASIKPARGHLGSALVLLLKTNGWLGVAAEESRKLQVDSPALWRYLRNDLGGIDMILFLVKGFVQEYIDRISLLEKQPEVFFQLMASLVSAGKTKEVFFPG